MNTRNRKNVLVALPLRLGIVLALALGLLVSLPVTPAYATCPLSSIVTSNADSGIGSLRDAIANTCADGTITFNSSLSGQTITLASTLTLSKNVTIDGSALASQVAVSGNDAVQVFVVNLVVNASLKNLTITKGYSASGYGGGGIHNEGILTVTNSTFSGNSAMYDGGGIYNDSWMMVTNSTFSGNSSDSSFGGGILNEGFLTVTNSTFSGNSAGFAGGGIDNNNSYQGTLNVFNSTFFGNSAAHYGGSIDNIGTATLKNTVVANSILGGNCSGGIGGSNNLTDDNSCGSNFTNSASILLSTLGNYGGSTQTIPLLPGSSAIDAGNAASCTTGSDQRGVSYVGTCDIGAFESQGFTLSKTNGDNQSATVSTAFTKPLALTVIGNNGEPVDGGVVTLTTPSSSGASLATTTYNLTIASGAASQNVTANGITGSYKVTASAAGATDVIFSLTNGDVPIINNVSNNGSISEGSSATITVSASNPTGISDVLKYEFDCDNNGSYEIGPQSTNTASCTFDDNGSFTVNVRVSNTYGSTTGSTIVVVNNVAPTAAFNTPASANEGANFNLLLTSPSDPSSADTTAGFTYAFDCGNGSGYGTFSAVNNTTCAAGHNNSQSVKGKIKDKDGGFTEYTTSVSVTPIALVVNTPAVTPEPSNEGSAVTASANFTASSAAAPFTCTLNYGDGSGALTGTLNSLTCTGPSHTYTDNGSFTVTVAVTGLDGTQSNTTTHTVRNVAPTAAFNAPATANVGPTFNLSLTSPSDPSSVDTSAGFTYAFDCGNGSGYGAFSAVNNTTCTAGHNSTQSVKGKIQDKDGGFTEYTASVSVDVTAPTVTAFSAPSTSSTLTIPVTTFTATDNVAVTGYMITTSPIAPLSGNAGWSASAPSTFTVASRGNYTLYPWAKDAAGNVSALYPSPAKVNVGNLLLNGGLNTYVNPSLIPQYWTAQGFALTDGKNTANVEEGLASVQVGSQKPAISKTLSQSIMLKGLVGNTFTFSFWVKGLNIPTSASCSAAVRFYREPVPTGPGTPLILVGTKIIPCPTGTFAFQQKSLTFAAPGDFTKIMVTFTYSAPTGTVWFDNAGLFIIR